MMGLAAALLVIPAKAARFLTGFAGSARAHFIEQALRLIAGAAFVAFSVEMRYPRLFLSFGWILLATSAALLFIPWRWHHRFGERVIPVALRHVKLYALGAGILGAFIIYSAV